MPLLRALGRHSPWEPGVVLNPPPLPSGMRFGPPDFVGVGAQKAGTTWWFALLAEHPGVFQSDRIHKERHYFARFADQRFDDSSIEEYWRWFPRPPGALAGEWTPDYMAQFWALPLLKRAAPDAKVLVLLRDPVERYRSGVTHALRRGQPYDAQVAIDAFERGFYARQLRQLWDLYPLGQVLVLQYERCIVQPESELARTYRFLGLDDRFRPSELMGVINATRGAKAPLDDHRREELIGLYRDDVEKLALAVPDFDLSIWPNFRSLVPPASTRETDLDAY